MYDIYSYPERGSREDYLMTVVMWHVATPEELAEWQAFQRPKVLEHWKRWNRSKAEKAQETADAYRRDAIMHRQVSNNKHIQYWLERANRCEELACYIEQLLAQDIIPHDYYRLYEGLITNENY